MLRLIADFGPGLMAYPTCRACAASLPTRGTPPGSHSTESILGLTVREAMGDKATAGHPATWIVARTVSA